MAPAGVFMITYASVPQPLGYMMLKWTPAAVGLQELRKAQQKW